MARISEVKAPGVSWPIIAGRVAKYTMRASEPAAISCTSDVDSHWWPPP